MEENKTEKKNIFVKAKEKFKEKKEKMKEKKESVFHFLAENPQITMSLFSALGTIGLGGAIAVSKASKRRFEACQVTDDITGEDLFVDHPLTNDEILELHQRMTCGQSKAEALRDMGLLR